MNDDIAVGRAVVDIWGSRGIVTEVEIPENLTIEDHGSICVYQIDKENYGLDNHEHYCYYNWRDVLKFLESPVEMSAKALADIDRIFRERDIKLFEDNPDMKMPVFVGRKDFKVVWDK